MLQLFYENPIKKRQAGFSACHPVNDRLCLQQFGERAFGREAVGQG